MNHRTQPRSVLMTHRHSHDPYILASWGDRGHMQAGSCGSCSHPRSGRIAMRIYKGSRAVIGIVALGLVVAGCGTTAEDDGASTEGDSGESEPVSGLGIMVPNCPGSGYDTTARAASKAHGGRRARQEHRGLQRRGRRWHRRAADSSVNEEQRQGAHADGPRCRRAPLHEQVRGHAGRDHADREADRGGRGDRRTREFAVQSVTNWSGVEGRTRASVPVGGASTRVVRTT